MPEDKELELLSCPFCGDAVRLFISDPDGNKYYYIECQGDFDCAGAMMDECAYGSKKQAIEAWNKRAE